MSGPQNEDQQNGGNRHPIWLIPSVHALVIEVGASLLTGSLLTAAGGELWHNIGLTLTVLVALSVATGVALYTLFHFNENLAGNLLSGLRTGLVWAARGTIWSGAGAAVVSVVVVSAYGIRVAGEQNRPCGQPLELRVLTTPDALTALRYAAAGFVRDERRGGCPEYAVTVAAEPGATAVKNGFARAWAADRTAVGTRLLGPQPDIWIPASTAEYRYADSAVSTSAAGQEPELERHPVSVGNSPMVLALFEDDNGAVFTGTPLRDSAAELLGTFEEVGLQAIARPIPESSSTALAVTPALQEAVAKAGLASAGEESERFVSPAEWLASDPVALLCEVRARAERQLRGTPGRAAAPVARPPRGVAVAVPENVLNDYNAGRPLGDRCGAVEADEIPYAQWKLYPYYARDLPTLDHPFVHVRWPGQATRQRDAAVDAFRGRLKEHPLTEQGLRGRDREFRTSDGVDPAGPYLNALDRLGNNIVPGTVPARAAPDVRRSLQTLQATRRKVQVALMLDASGSMGAPASTARDNRLTVAVSFLRNLLNQLGDQDVAGLQTFRLLRPGEAIEVSRPEGAGLMSADRLKKLTDRLLVQAPAGKDGPLADAILRADLRSGDTELLVVTDGQVSGTNPGLDQDVERLARFHRDEPRVRVTMLLTGPTGCADSPVEEIIGALRGRCEQLGDAADQEQAARLLSRLRLP